MDAYVIKDSNAKLKALIKQVIKSLKEAIKHVVISN